MEIYKRGRAIQLSYEGSKILEVEFGLEGEQDLVLDIWFDHLFGEPPNKEYLVFPYPQEMSKERKGRYRRLGTVEAYCYSIFDDGFELLKMSLYDYMQYMLDLGISYKVGHVNYTEHTYREACNNDLSLYLEYGRKGLVNSDGK